MELLLNIAWTLMAAGVLWAWRRHWIHQRSRTPRDCLYEWTAIGVALVLLFFAVSMTDDLHYEMALSEESASSRRNMPCSIGGHSSPQPGSLTHPCPRVMVENVSWCRPAFALEKVALFVAWPSGRPLNHRLSGRAPPVSYL
jgi:hypothetical protein